jgi:hypothetical protein
MGMEMMYPHSESKIKTRLHDAYITSIFIFTHQMKRTTALPYPVLHLHSSGKKGVIHNTIPFSKRYLHDSLASQAQKIVFQLKAMLRLLFKMLCEFITHHPGMPGKISEAAAQQRLLF